MNNSKTQVIGKLNNHPFITCVAQGVSINALEGKKRNEKMTKNGIYKLTIMLWFMDHKLPLISPSPPHLLAPSVIGPSTCKQRKRV